MTDNKMLSKREEEILAELNKGATYLKVGQQLYISENTVRSHIRNIYEKLEVSNRTSAINKWKADN
jgi:DNA-binding CsgD family transcriptional regulator